MLDAQQVQVKEERASRKQPLSDQEAQALLASLDEVIIAKGKNSQLVPATQATLDQLRGPTGNFRAPMLRRGRRLLVGFSEPALLDFLRA